MFLLEVFNKLPQTIYCERGFEQGLFVEPSNAFSNLAYVIAGFLAYRMLKSNQITDRKLLLLPWLLLIIGIGSFIYHTERNVITLLFDAIPLFFFILYILFLVLEEIQRSKLKAAIVLLGFIVIEIFLTIYIPKEFFNGSIRHITAVFFCSLIGLIAYKKFGNKIIKPLLLVISLYALAIIFRSVDMIVCPFIPIGAHFLWHILAALSTYQAIALVTTIKSESELQRK